MTPEHQQRKDDNHWCDRNLDQLAQRLNEKIEGQGKLFEELRKADEQRYQQRFEAQQEHLETMNRFRDQIEGERDLYLTKREYQLQHANSETSSKLQSENLGKRIDRSDNILGEVQSEIRAMKAAEVQEEKSQGVGQEKRMWMIGLVVGSVGLLASAIVAAVAGYISSHMK
jgi:hypothetical protein